MEGKDERRRSKSHENSRQDGIRPDRGNRFIANCSHHLPPSAVSSPLRQFLPFNRIMAPVRSSASWLSSVMAVCAILCLSVPANALYFYMDGRQTKCFFEELPKDTLVVGMLLTTCSPNLFTT